MKQIAIIGGGPAAMMFATHIDTAKYKVTLFEKNKSLGRKFLVAGDGGLNLTFNCPPEELASRYYPPRFMDSAIKAFSNEDLITFLNELGIDTFVGSSNRVFASRDRKPVEVLGKIVDYIRSRGVEIQFGKKFTGLTENGVLIFEDGTEVMPEICVFALGGASYKVTGSDGAWKEAFEKRGIRVNKFRAANCAFSVDWQKDFIAGHEGKPLKNIALNFGSMTAKGELVITKFGLEGNAIYALSREIQDALSGGENVTVKLDLKPTMTNERILEKYESSRYKKATDILQKDLNLNRTAIALLKQFTNKEIFINPESLAKAIKSIPVKIQKAGDIDEAISTLGGIDLDEVDENFGLKKMPDTYAIGEMLDWFAPTGGFLLQGCFSMGFTLAKYLNRTL
jgi:uncharacterized flavoprotein (TIGR03862 family)